MAIEIDLSKVEAPIDNRRNVQKKVRIEGQLEHGDIGEISHYHKQENETEIWEEPCRFVEHIIRIPGGIDINDTSYTYGKHVVPQCLADQFASMEAAWNQAERGLFRSNKLEKVAGNF